VLCLGTFFLLVSIVPVYMYGPYSHYVFACQSLIDSTYPIIPNSLYIGSDLPDGMWNGWFMSGTACPSTANQLHNPIYAGYMIVESLNNPLYNKDPVYYSLAVGYATHTIADAVGFSPLGGYLGNVSSIINWSTKWIQMLALDALIVKEATTYPFSAVCLPSRMVVPKNPLNQAGLQFMADSLAVFHAAFPNSPIFNASQLATCTDPWAPAVNEMNSFAEIQLNETIVQNLVFFDVFKAKTLLQIQRELFTSFGCIMKSITYYMQQILQTAEPEHSWTLTSLYITQLFNQGECTAPTKNQ